MGFDGRGEVRELSYHMKHYSNEAFPRIHFFKKTEARHRSLLCYKCFRETSGEFFVVFSPKNFSLSLTYSLRHLKLSCHLICK